MNGNKGLLRIVRCALLLTHTPLAADEESDYPYQQHVGDIYAATLARLKATDIDQEVKEMAITCM